MKRTFINVQITENTFTFCDNMPQLQAITQHEQLVKTTINLNKKTKNMFCPKEPTCQNLYKTYV